MATGREKIQPRKSLGQHWLNDQYSLNQICDYAELSKNDTVLEVGPGTGNLTTLLLNKAKNVIAVELDENLVSRLEQKRLQNLEIVNQDILQFNFNEVVKDFKIVANIPYYLTGKLIRQISETENRPSLAVLLVQKEIAERMSAKPGDMSVLGIISQFFWEVQKGIIITPDKFDPPPKVDSQVVILKAKKVEELNIDNQQQFFKLIRIGFISKRKTILNNLSAIENVDKNQLRIKLEENGINPDSRPQSFSLEDWHKLYKIIH